MTTATIRATRSRWGALLLLWVCGLAIAADPLPSWNDTAPKAAVIAFVEKITRAGGPDFVPQEQRIAVFDMDGTLIPEQPVPAAVIPIVSELKRAVAANPALAGKPAVSDKEGKPPVIDLGIGMRPLLVGGNVRSGGDIAMMRYSNDRHGPSPQLLINHDDAERELAYAEPDGYSLREAAAHGFMVVSVRNDWARIFSEPTAR